MLFHPERRTSPLFWVFLFLSVFFLSLIQPVILAMSHLSRPYRFSRLKTYMSIGIFGKATENS
jgi:hypothetical protein